MKIIHSTKHDIPAIFDLYALATAYQLETFPENRWPVFDKNMIQQEITEKRQFKLLIDDQIACIWAITYNDPEIWTEDDGKSSLFIHRIATNPNFRGNNFVKTIVDWAREFASDKQFIRLDTCGHNHKLIQHYQACGFEFLGIKELKEAKNLPAHYHRAAVCYFEIKLSQE